ncbi:hypothetical protein AVEN_52490-1 [Araneus ventricosus]|uniref:Uncharacterized protein n=1 Tax=Araneus ventricosus TaxID=182803 RepID=A0A4Y2KVU0_ARAVE|nr:hypothetical protein AVEN_99100-1 [Araneus ventricosus]GBN06574.1 hypothetical protein AVEN_52490-1 [Araneus ventricosus]
MLSFVGIGLVTLREEVVQNFEIFSAVEMLSFVLEGESFFSFFLFVTSLKSVKSGEAEVFSHNGATDGKEGFNRLVIAGILGIGTDCLEVESADISWFVSVDGAVDFFTAET